MANAAVASTLTASLLSSTTFVIDPAIATPGVAAPVFNGLTGKFVSDQLQLPGTPVTSSIVRWTATVPAGTTLNFFTSINNGASWDPASNNGHIPRLQPGDIATRTVMVKAEWSRPTVGSTSPRLSFLQLQVSCDTGTFELVPIGYGYIDKDGPQTSVSGGTSSGGGGAGVTSRGGGQTGGGTSGKLHVLDPSSWIKNARWEQPFTVPVGTNYTDAVLLMARNRYPYLDRVSAASTTRTLPSALIYGSSSGGDPWQDIREVAQAYGFECFFDAAGVFVLRPVPDPRTSEPVYEIDQTSNPLVTDVKQEFNSDKIFNYVICKGESTSSANPISAFAVNDDPSSRSNVKRIGVRSTGPLQFPQITDPAQLQEAANTILYNSLGASDTVTITVVPQPFLEPGDIIRLNLPEPGINGTYLIQSMTTPLSPGEAQQLVCFRQTDREGQ